MCKHVQAGGGAKGAGRENPKLTPSQAWSLTKAGSQDPEMATWAETQESAASLTEPPRYPQMMIYNKEVDSVNMGYKYHLKGIKKGLMNSCPFKQILKVGDHQIVGQGEIFT